MISGWASSYTSQVPRRSHDQSNPDQSAIEDAAESRRRSSSDATPRPTPAPTPRIHASGSSNTQDQSRSILSATSSEQPSTGSSSRRLGYLADKISSSLSVSGHSTVQKSSHNPSQLLHPHSHSRVESSLPPSRDQASSPLPPSLVASSSSMSGTSRVHTSPSKAPYGRTYDPKLVSREMHRLGNLAHLPSSLPSVLSAAPSASSLNLSTSGNMSSVNLTSSSDPWSTLHVHVLPLFNGEQLRIPIEDLNALVTTHLETVVSSAPQKALATLENDVSELIASGMVTLNAKLSGIDDNKLVGRVVEIWGFFWDQVLTYVEGVLLPLQTHSMLSSVYRTPKQHRSTSPGRQNVKSSSSLNGTIQPSSLYYIDVRSVALRSFRDKVILPLKSKLYNRLSTKQDFQDPPTYQQARLQQMLLVLAAQSRHRPPSFSLTASAPQLSPGESAVTDLLRVIRCPGSHNDRLRAQTFRHIHGTMAHQATFLSGALPRDRRGRIAQKKKGKSGTIMAGSEGEEDELAGDGAETPRNELGGMTVDAKREQELLEALRSPDPEGPTVRSSTGGWGLGADTEERGRQVEIDEDEPLDWDKAQEAVEQMVGMK